MESNEAAAELVLANELPDIVARVIKKDSPSPQSIEILMRVRAIEGTANGFDIVGIRSSPS